MCISEKITYCGGLQTMLIDMNQRLPPSSIATISETQWKADGP